VNATHLAELYDLLRIPSVSADPNHAADVRRAGEWVRDLVRSAKGGEAELVEEHLRELAVVVLPGVDDDLLDPALAERDRGGPRLHELRPVPDDGDDFHWGYTKRASGR